MHALPVGGRKSGASVRNRKAGKAGNFFKKCGDFQKEEDRDFPPFQTGRNVLKYYIIACVGDLGKFRRDEKHSAKSAATPARMQKERKRFYMEYTFARRISKLQPSAIREILKFTSQPGIISFAAGNPAPDAFPVEEIRRLSAEIFETRPIDALQYSITEGYPALREHLFRYMQEKYAVGTEGDRLLVTSGANQVMELVSKVFCNEGDTVICESPSFIGSLNAFRSYGVHLCGVPVEADGMNLELLEQALKTEQNVRFIYTIPNFQNPSGVTMSLEKRKKLYALAKQYGVLILEDNPYGETRFAGETIPPIKSLDTEGLVIYAGSLSKVVAAGLRVGYAIAPEAIISKMVVCKQVNDVHTNIWSQLVSHAYLTQCDFDAHLADIQKIYKRKAGLMMSLLDRHLCPHGFSYNPVEGGLFLWVKLPAGLDMPAFCTAAVKAGVAVVPGNAFLMDESEPCDYIRLNFSTPTDEQMEKGMAILEQVALEMLKK